jgi:hypothetical protein
MKKHTEALVVASKVNGIEVKAGKTKYMVLSRNHEAGRIHTVQFDNSAFEKDGRVQIFGNNRIE